MTRWRQILAALGVVASAAVGVGVYTTSSAVDQVSVRDLARFRDGRTRLARQGPVTGATCTPYGVAINYATYSQEFDNGAWTAFANTTAPTVTPNAGVAAPSCASSFSVTGCGLTGVVDRVQFPATGLGQFTGIRNIATGPGGGGQFDAYVYAIAGPGGCPDGLDLGTSDVNYFFTTTAVGGSWVRLADVVGAVTGSGTTIYIGNLSATARPSDTLGAITRQACDVYLFQADINTQGDEHIPVKTTSSSATRGPVCL